MMLVLSAGAVCNASQCLQWHLRHGQPECLVRNVMLAKCSFTRLCFFSASDTTDCCLCAIAIQYIVIRWDASATGVVGGSKMTLLFPGICCRALWLMGNQLAGTIPSALSSMTALRCVSEKRESSVHAHGRTADVAAV
jgi:hypothetical protein